MTSARFIIELLLKERFKGSLQRFSIALFPQETDVKKQSFRFLFKTLGT